MHTGQAQTGKTDSGALHNAGYPFRLFFCIALTGTAAERR